MYRHKSYLKHIDFIIFDYLILELSFLAGTIAYIGIKGNWRFLFNEFYWHQAVILAICVAASLVLGHPYKNILKRDKWREFSATAKHTCNLLIAYLFLIFFTHEAESVTRLTVALTWCFYFVIEYVFRLFWKRSIRRRAEERGYRAGNAMILLTERDRLQRVLAGLKTTALSPYFIKAVFLFDYGKDKNQGASIQEIPILGDMKQAVSYSANHWVDEVLIAPYEFREEAMQAKQYFEEMGITTHRVLMEIPDSWHDGSAGVEVCGNFLISTQMLRFVPFWQWACKRFMDVIGSVIGLAFTGILYLFIAPQIKKADKGPAIYTSIRIGKNGKPFRFYKFRSMYLDADERKAELMKQNKMQGLMFKMDNDPRILPGIGTFIRKTSLDEFPQFLNVLKGDMSLVGTRPPTEDEWKQYSRQHRIRLTQRPGITGIWQVSGRSSITDFNEIVKMDEEYIETWTIGMDIRILLKTVKKVLRREGAE